MILRITEQHVRQANQARLDGQLMAHTCPTAQCFKDMGYDVMVGFTGYSIKGRDGVIQFQNVSLLRQIDNWTHGGGFIPGNYEVEVPELALV